MNFSEEHNAFLWLPNKTGSNHALKVFEKYGFKNYEKKSNSYELKPIKASHTYDYPFNHENYLFICTARNPFSRILSMYKFNNKNPLDWNPEHFRTFFFSRFTSSKLEKLLYPFDERTPDIFIRVENLLLDYTSLEFIKKSDFCKSGELAHYCELKINSTTEIKNPQDFYTQDMIDFVVEGGRKYFDLLKYQYPF